MWLAADRISQQQQPAAAASTCQQQQQPACIPVHACRMSYTFF
jgi:hypothetical protein